MVFIPRSLVESFLPLSMLQNGGKGNWYFAGGCFAVATTGVFRVSGRGISLFASGGLLFPAAGKVAKRAGRNQRFLHFLARYAVGKSESACRTFTQIFLCRFVKGLSQQQRRCR